MDPATDQDNPTFSWRAHPALERPRRALAGLGVIAVLAACCGLLMQSGWWSLLAAVILVVALNRFYFPSRFTADLEGITARYPLRRQRLAWTDLRRFVHDRDGGHLSTRRRRSWIDAGRGMHLLFGSDPDAVIDQISARFDAGQGAVEDVRAEDAASDVPLEHDRLHLEGGRWAH